MWIGTKMRDNKITVLLPAYNEEQSIHSTIEQIKSVMSATKLQYELIVVNDGSTDSTKSILEKEEGIILLSNPYNLGYGASLKKGIKVAKFPWILMIDADGTYPIKEIPDLIRYMGDYDMVVGARTGKNVYVPFMRRPAKFILTTLAKFLTRKKIPDLNSGMRLFKKEIAMEFFNLFPSGFSFTTTITLACLTNDYTVKFVPIDYLKRKGKSTIHPINDFVNFNKIIFKIVFYFEPSKFFLWPGFFLIFIGVFYGFYQVFTSFPRNLGQFPVMLFLSGLQIAFLGLIAELIVKSRKKIVK